MNRAQLSATSVVVVLLAKSVDGLRESVTLLAELHDCPMGTTCPTCQSTRHALRYAREAVKAATIELERGVKE
jgi:hypothetical protein